MLKKEGKVISTIVQHDEESTVILLPEVKSEVLGMVLDYCRYHSKSDVCEKTKKTWDTEFVQALLLHFHFRIFNYIISTIFLHFLNFIFVFIVILFLLYPFVFE